MPDVTHHFLANPRDFLLHTSLIVNVRPDHNPTNPVGHFKITADVAGGMTESALELDLTNSSNLTAYWCAYAPNTATLLTVGAAANFMFTANMDGCTFGTNGSGGPTHMVGHFNHADKATDIQRIMNEQGYFDNPAEAQLAGSMIQRALQQSMAQQGLGGQAKIRASIGRHCTTVVGVRDATTGWAFYKQVNRIDGMGSAIDRSLSRF